MGLHCAFLNEFIARYGDAFRLEDARAYDRVGLVFVGSAWYDSLRQGAKRRAREARAVRKEITLSAAKATIARVMDSFRPCGQADLAECWDADCRQALAVEATYREWDSTRGGSSMQSVEPPWMWSWGGGAGGFVPFSEMPITDVIGGEQ